MPGSTAMHNGLRRLVTTNWARVPDTQFLKTNSIRDLRAFSTRRETKVIFSGIQPTGRAHLGNYLGALKQWVELQKGAAEEDRLFYCIVDSHATTVPQRADDLRRWSRETFAVLLAIGLDPERCTIFYQSQVAEHDRLMNILNGLASTGYLERMTQWKSKLGLSDEASNGLFSYPVLQAADILLYGTTHVPVGDDQRQHLEFTRYLAKRFNARYGDVFVMPQTLLSPAKRVMSLTEPHLKMSKSHADPRSRIHLDDKPEEIAEKIKLALTDSTAGVSYDSVARPGVSNLLDILSHLDPSERPPSELAAMYNAFSMRAFKEEVTAAIIASLAGIRKRYHQLIQDNDSHYLEDIARAGFQKASTRAAETLSIVRHLRGYI